MVYWQELLLIGQHWLSSLGNFAYPVFIGIYLLANLLGLPAIFLFLAAGSLFGFIPGLIIVSFADTLSVATCYLLGRTIARGAVSKWLAQRPHWSRLDHAVAQKGWKIVLLTRLSPIIPSNILNYGFSLTKINFWQYLFVSWIGMLPVIALYVYLASVGVNLVSGNHDHPKQVIASIIGLITTITAIAYTSKLMHNILTKPAGASPLPQHQSRSREKVRR